jgi:hypothetical protein
MAGYLQKFIDYIRNTGRVPLPVEFFDDDWEPVGPTVRSDLIDAGLITIRDDGIRLTEEGQGNG